MDAAQDLERDQRRGVTHPIRMANILTLVATLVGFGTLVATCAAFGAMRPDSVDGPGGDEAVLLWALWISGGGLVVVVVLAAFAVLLRWCATLYRRLDRPEP